MTGQPAYIDADVQAAAKAVARAQYEGFVAAQHREPLPAPNERYARAVLDAVVPGIVARAKAEALREMAEAMDSGWIDMDDLRYKTTDAPKGWAEPCIRDAWESMLVWAPYLRVRADEIEAGR